MFNMSEKVNKGDFVVVEYTGKLDDGTVFDTTDEQVAKDNQLFSEKAKYEPAKICVGQNQLLPGLDNALVGQEISSDFEVVLEPEQAFGKRDIKKLRIVPISTFKEHNVVPQPGLTIDVDGEKGTVNRVSGGRVIVNFNHPLAGKKVTYLVKILGKITDTKEQIISFLSSTMRLAADKLKVEVTEKQAQVTLPITLPAEFLEALSKELAKLVHLDKIEIKSNS